MLFINLERTRGLLVAQGDAEGLHLAADQAAAAFFLCLLRAALLFLQALGGLLLELAALFLGLALVFQPLFLGAAALLGLFAQAQPLGFLLLHELILCQLLDQHLADLHVGQIVVLGEFLNDLVDEFRLELALLRLARDGYLAVLVVLEIALEHDVVEQNVMENVLLQLLVDDGVLLDNLDRVADLVISAQELQKLHHRTVVGILFQQVRLVDRALDPVAHRHFLGKIGIHERAQNAENAADAVEDLAVLLVGIQHRLGVLDVQEHVHVHALGSAVHVGAQLELGAEFVAHRGEQRLVADAHEVVSRFQRREHQAVFIHADVFLAVALHQLRRAHVPGLGVEILDVGGVMRQIAHHVRPGFLRVGHVDDEFVLPDLNTWLGDDVLEALQRVLDGVDPALVHVLDFLAVGKLDLVVGAGDGAHEELIELRVAQRAHDAAGEFLIDRVDEGRLLRASLFLFGVGHALTFFLLPSRLSCSSLKTLCSSCK